MDCINRVEECLNLNQNRDVAVYNAKFLTKKCPEKSILSVVSGGNTSNRIFEYLSVYSLAKLSDNKFEAFVPFQLKDSLLLLFQEPSLPIIEAIENDCLIHKISINLDCTTDSIYINLSDYQYVELGMYSARYEEILKVGMDNIRQELRFRTEDIDQARQTLHAISKNFSHLYEKTFIAMHYRGGDYIHHLQLFTKSVPSSYIFYQKAMDFFKSIYKDPLFILISADNEWINTNAKLLIGNLVINPNWGKANNKVKDFVLMSHCNHTILNYGTFGTFAALYNGGKAVVYDLHIPLDHRGHTVAMGIAQILPNWILLDND